GNIKLFGKQITLKGQSGVTFDGNVEYELGESNAPESADAIEPVEIDEIEALISENEAIQRVSGLRWRQQTVDVTQCATLEFSHQHFEPGASALIKIIQIVDNKESIIAEKVHDLANEQGIETVHWWPEEDVTAEHRFLETKEALPLTPVQFRFEVDVEGITHTESNLLQLTRYITYTTNNAATDDGTIIVYDAQATPLYADLQNHRADIGPVLLGPIFAEITKVKGNDD
ncbi:MAG: hypothetical protein R3309_14655, partial [Reinekea sp.]|nr:hypothetical protein [Reinekea sp.]